jgi:hypothetical protein
MAHTVQLQFVTHDSTLLSQGSGEDTLLFIGVQLLRGRP